MIEMDDLHAGYGRRPPVLRGVDLQIPPGLYGLLGPNGSGKSTLLRVLATVLAPRAGQARIAGHSVGRGRDAVRRLIGYMPQDGSPYPQSSVRESLDYLAGLSGLPGGRDRALRIERALEWVHLTGEARTPVKRLSGSMRQRLSIAQALLHDPAVILADEPTSSLDPVERLEFRALLARLGSERTVLFSTHLAGDIGAICSRVAVLNNGRVAFSGTATELAERARGRLWQAIVPVHRVGELLQERWPVARLQQTHDGMLVRIVAPQQAHFQPVHEAPTLEEGYLALIGDPSRPARPPT